MIDLFFPIFIAAIPLAALPALIGPILIWGRMSFLSDVIAHAGILAFGCAEFFQVPTLLMAFGVTSFIIICLELRPKIIPKDAWLSALSSLCIALGLVFLSLFSSSGTITSIFYGDLLNISTPEAFFLCVLTVFVAIHIKIFWKTILLEICSRELSFLKGGGNRAINIILKLFYGIAITLCLKWIGVLLTSALFVIPGIFMRFVARSPHQQILATFLTLFIGIELGIFFSLQMDVLIVPSIILSILFFGFLIVFIKSTYKKKSPKALNF